MRVAAAVIVLLLAVLAGAVRAEEETDVEKQLAALEAWRGKTVLDITLAGNHITKSWVIAREIWTEEGEPLDPDLVRQDIIRLENLAIFGSVVVTPSPLRDGVSLDFVFTEMPWIIPYPAIGYTEENGFSIGLGVSSPNFLGRKVNLSASAMFGGTTTYRFKGENPWITGNHVSAGVEAWHQVRQNELLEFGQTTDNVTLRGGTYLGVNGRFKAHGGYYGVGSDTDGITLDPDNYDDLWNGGTSLGWDTRDSWRVPRAGWNNELALLYLGGDGNTLAIDFDVRRYLTVNDRHALATGPLFSFQTGQVDEEIPSYMQYFLGGANSVRGYKLEELGKELFGKNQLLYTLEYRYQILPLSPLKIFKWSIGVGLEAAAFGDAGIVWSRAQDFNLDRTRVGAGVGLRLLIPGTEMLRFDMGLSQFGDIVFNFGVNSIFTGRRKRIR